MMEPDYIRAHEFSIRHRKAILKSDLCGCFYCLAIFKPEKITQWIEEGTGREQTALCPKCGIDSVIGSDSGFPITEEFLKKMSDYWF